jgi:hypothetical protein
MSKPSDSRSHWSSLLLLAAALAVSACRPPEPVPVQMGQPMHMGDFYLRAATVELRRDLRYGGPDKLTVTFALSGGSRFDRMEFIGRVAQQGVFLRSASGWRDRYSLDDSTDDQESPRLVAEPPRGSHGFKVEIGNPYGSPPGFIVDLGQ